MTSNFVGKISLTSAGYANGIDLGVFTWKESWKEPCTSFGYMDVPASEQEYSSDEGASLEITITGEYGTSSTTWANIATWKKSIQDLITGSQYDDSADRYLAIYSSDGVWPINNTAAPIHIILESFDPEIPEGTAPMCKYTLKCYQQVSY